MAQVADPALGDAGRSELCDRCGYGFSNVNALLD
jgi:hypothetical protein